ncbi:hypothetical protein EJJ20_16980 [Pseudomonas poae]|nr:hypothetical protein EJJ20_16980 [Pseudomonas poae]
MCAASLIARVHQYGLKDRAERYAPTVKYERREILGFASSDLDLIRDELLSHFAEQKFSFQDRLESQKRTSPIQNMRN